MSSSNESSFDIRSDKPRPVERGRYPASGYPGFFPTVTVPLPVAFGAMTNVTPEARARAAGPEGRPIRVTPGMGTWRSTRT